MSVHGICYDNGQSGRCNHNCEQFLVGQCDIGDEIVEMLHNDLTQEEVTVELQCLYDGNDVELFLLRGEGRTDLELMISGYGY